MSEVYADTTTSATTPNSYDAARLVSEGYGPGAWHGPDLKAALADVTPQLAFWRPGPERHNIAEIALHHAWYVQAILTKLTGQSGDSFPLAGEDWFEVSNGEAISWAEISRLVANLHGRLDAAAADLDSGRIRSPLPEPDRFGLLLGITCHAIYHAGQVQLIKVLAAAASGAVTPESASREGNG